MRLALVSIHRFFSASLVVFFILWLSSSSPGSAVFSFKGFLHMSSTIKEELKVEVNQANARSSDGWNNNGWFYNSVRICLFLWVALLNLITISSNWGVIDVMDSEVQDCLVSLEVVLHLVSYLAEYLLL